MPSFKHLTRQFCQEIFKITLSSSPREPFPQTVPLLQKETWVTGCLRHTQKGKCLSGLSNFKPILNWPCVTFSRDMIALRNLLIPSNIWPEIKQATDIAYANVLLLEQHGKINLSGLAREWNFDPMQILTFL